MSNEALMGREIVFTIQNAVYSVAGGKGPRPERLPLPKPAHEARAEDAAMDAKARAHQARAARAGK